jgi:hypothetical protein
MIRRLLAELGTCGLIFLVLWFLFVAWVIIVTLCGGGP